MGWLQRLTGAFGGASASALAFDQRQAPYGRFDREANNFLAGFMPMLREASDVIGGSWDKQAGRVVHAYQHSGFIRGVLDVSTAQTVGTGLRMSARPDGKTLGWSEEFTAEFARQREASFQAWARNPYHCDAGGQINFGMMQQAFYWCGLAFGEGLGLMPTLRRNSSRYGLKVKLLPPSRIVSTSDGLEWVQGVKVDKWGMPLAYKLYEKDAYGSLAEREVPARDKDGRPIVLHHMMPTVAQTRNVSDIATGMKAYRQFDQYSDANLTKKMIQTIFAAVVKSNLQGLAAFEGLMTEGDQINPTGALDVAAFGAAKAGWYDGSKIDLSAHGRIAHMFPNDELDFVESKSAGDDFDPIARWLWLEIAAAAGVSYESATGDYRGATYSSVRMAGAKEWLSVLRRREALVEPFCRAVADALLEEDIGTGRIEIPGGLPAFYENRDAICHSTWAGPRQPQADDFKTARAHQVRKEMGATTLAEILSDYGMDWDDAMRQQARENALATQLKLPLPWAPTDILQTKKGQELSLKNDGEDDPGNRPDSQPLSPKKKGPGKDDPERDPADAVEQEINPEADDGD